MTLTRCETQRLSVTVLVDCLPDEHGTPVFELTTVHSSLQAARYDALQTVAFALEKGTTSGDSRRSGTLMLLKANIARRLALK